MNLAKSLEPYRYNTVFTQSPLAADGSAYKNSSSSALLHRETIVSAFQYPFALNLNDCCEKPEWTKKLLQAIGELNGVSGNHARSYYEMAPASIVLRLTNQLVAGYETYGFKSNGTAGAYGFPEVIDGILHGSKPEEADYPGKEFYIGGRIVKEMSEEKQAKLQERGVSLFRDPRKLLCDVAEKALGGNA